MRLYQGKKKKSRISPFRPPSVAMVLEGAFRDELDVFVQLNKQNKPTNDKEDFVHQQFATVPTTENTLRQIFDKATTRLVINIMFYIITFFILNCTNCYPHVDLDSLLLA